MPKSIFVHITETNRAWGLVCRGDIHWSRDYYLRQAADNTKSSRPNTHHLLIADCIVVAPIQSEYKQRLLILLSLHLSEREREREYKQHPPSSQKKRIFTPKTLSLLSPLDPKHCVRQLGRLPHSSIVRRILNLGYSHQVAQYTQGLAFINKKRSCPLHIGEGKTLISEEERGLHHRESDKPLLKKSSIFDALYEDFILL